MIKNGLPQRRHRRHANPFSLQKLDGPIDVHALFAKALPIALDVGCGPGQFVVALAQARPDLNVLGLDIRPHLVEAVNELAHTEQVSSRAHAVRANAATHLKDILGPAQDVKVAMVTFNFPDPWYKNRHHKRRVLTLEWLRAIEPYLCPEAELHAMTDFFPLAQNMRKIMEHAPSWRSAFVNGVWPKTSTTGIHSERELIHMARKEPIWRLAYRFLSL